MFDDDRLRRISRRRINRRSDDIPGPMDQRTPETPSIRPTLTVVGYTFLLVVGIATQPFRWIPGAGGKQDRDGEQDD
jgi:hypothetical protein